MGQALHKRQFCQSQRQWYAGRSESLAKIYASTGAPLVLQNGHSSLFPSIHRQTLPSIWRHAVPRLPVDPDTLIQLDQVATAILTQSPIDPPPIFSGNRTLLAKIPSHKSLYHAPPNVGLPVGSLSSQFFANVYLNELDQFIKHTLKVRAYLRYVDDFVMLADDPKTMLTYKNRIAEFLQERLQLKLHPHKTVIQRSNQGIDYLGSIIYPHYKLVRQRSVRALRKRINWFNQLIFGDNGKYSNFATGSWAI